jgi:hypothetical protein
MKTDKTIEALARMWMECDPNRGGTDPDELMPMKLCSGGIGPEGVSSVEYPNPLGGLPRWHWFIPRAEASLAYLKNKGVLVGEPCTQ